MNPPDTGPGRCPPSCGDDAVKYRGVRKRAWGKWVSEIRLPHSRERIWLGSYDSAEKAARAFDAAMYCLRGRDTAAGARFNFPNQIPDHIPRARELSPTEIQVAAAEYANDEILQEAVEGDVRRQNPATADVQQQQQQQQITSSDGSSQGFSITADDAFDSTFDDSWPLSEFQQGNTSDAVDPGFFSSSQLCGDFLWPMQSPQHLCSSHMLSPPHLPGPHPPDGSDGSIGAPDSAVAPACQHTSFLWDF